MIITSLSALAVSVRSTLARNTSNTATPSPTPSTPTAAAEPVVDSVQLSTRAETLARTLDADSDGAVTKEEFTDGGVALLKRASVRFHHERIGKGQGIEKRDARWTGRLEDVFAHVDRNHDGAIDATELTSALPKPAQRFEQRQPTSATQTATGAPTNTQES